MWISVCVSLLCPRLLVEGKGNQESRTEFPEPFQAAADQAEIQFWGSVEGCQAHVIRRGQDLGEPVPS